MKKANFAIEAVTLIVILLAFGLVVVIGSKMATEVNTQIQASNQLSPHAKTIIDDAVTGYPSLFDNLFVVVFVLIFMAGLASAFFVDYHPIIFYLSLLLIIIFTLLVAIFGNVFDDITSNSQLSSEAVKFSMMNFITQHILIIGIVMVFTMAVVAFAKARSD